MEISDLKASNQRELRIQNSKIKQKPCGIAAGRAFCLQSSFDLFDPHLNMNPVLDPYNVVLEVKFNGFLLSYIRDLINCTDKSELSVSKYVLARQNAYQTHL